MAAAPKKKLDAVRAEVGADAEPRATVTINGRDGSAEVELLPPLEWAFDVEDSIASGRFGAVFEALMDAENVAKARAVHPTVPDAMDFIRAVKNGDGVSLGESQAS